MEKNNFLEKKYEIFSKTKQYFVRVMKEKKLYHVYKIAMNHWMKDYLMKNNIHRYDEAYKKCFDTIYNSAKSEFNSRNSNSPYDFVTACINGLLNSICEVRMKLKPQVLGMYGQNIFDATCYALFPKDYSNDLKTMDELKSPSEMDWKTFGKQFYEPYAHRCQREGVTPKSLAEFLNDNKGAIQNELDKVKRMMSEPITGSPFMEDELMPWAY